MSKKGGGGSFVQRSKTQRPKNKNERVKNYKKLQKKEEKSKREIQDLGKEIRF